ncbi:hypothetical protein QUA43_31115 [Microcoleus sp. N9_B4]|uniref:hypothetical protein n=1 Tax=Microcoleus sp. N9_B4 TaxID=3055386 RepID=UPI002FD5EC31
MTETYAESQAQAPRGTKNNKDLRIDTDSNQNAGRLSTGTGTQRISPNRKGSEEGNILSYAVGGMLDQLIDDAEKQLVKSNECIVWYREEVKEYEHKLNNFRRLKELHQQQMAAAEAEASNLLDEATESSNDSNGGEDLAE